MGGSARLQWACRAEATADTKARAMVRSLAHGRRVCRLALALLLQAARAGGADWASSGWSWSEGVWNSGFRAENLAYDRAAFAGRAVRVEGDLGSVASSAWLSRPRYDDNGWPLAERRCFSQPVKMCVFKNMCRELNASTIVARPAATSATGIGSSGHRVSPTPAPAISHLPPRVYAQAVWCADRPSVRQMTAMPARARAPSSSLFADLPAGGGIPAVPAGLLTRISERDHTQFQRAPGATPPPPIAWLKGSTFFFDRTWHLPPTV